MLCPVDATPLVMADRSGVEIDYCPKCRGVWLDRGELQKLLAVIRTEAEAADATPAPQAAAATYAPQTQPGFTPHAGQPVPTVPTPPGYAQGYAPPGGYPPPGQPGWHTRHDDSDDELRKRGGYYPHGYRKKSTFERIFDIFD